MKKELLMGTALVSTLGAASVAEAVTATMSGNHQNGMSLIHQLVEQTLTVSKMITTLLCHYLKLLMV